MDLVWQSRNHSNPTIRPVLSTSMKTLPFLDARKPRMEKICFTLQVKPESVPEYAARHEHVWTEMQKALRRSGWHNYSLFLRADGLAIGYLETQDFAESLRSMEQFEVNARWQASMKTLTPTFEGRRVDQTLERLPLIFDLDEPA